MFSYLHRYHAGSFADVHKHLILVALLSNLQKKSTPFCILDSHAGEGIYDLNAKDSQKNAEHEQGIDRLFQIPDHPTLVQAFIQIINEYNTTPEKQNYPGSPAIIKHFLRARDRGILVEGHPQAIIQLRRHFGKDPQIHIHERDSLESIKALVPFKENRGLIFIDPSFEVKTDYKNVADVVIQAQLRFDSTYAIWYPILPSKQHETLLRKIKQAALQKVWNCEWSPYPRENPTGLMGSGMVIINTPWQVDKLIGETFSWLNKNIFTQGIFYQRWLSRDDGAFRAKW